MGFFFNQARQQAKKVSAAQKKHIPIESMRALGCKACPLDKTAGQLQSPKMQALGNDNPLIYVLGDLPSEDADIDNKPITGDEVKIIKASLPPGYYRDLRTHNVIQCHIPGYVKGFPRQPELAETECCRGHIVADIERAKPEVIVGLGPVPLKWATDLSGGITQWRGRLIAVQIGSHQCWYFPIYHPSHVINKKKKWGKSEIEMAFDKDWNHIIELVEKNKLGKPAIHQGPYDTGIVSITGESAGDYNLLEDMLNSLAKEEYNGLDLETSGLRPWHANSKIFTAAAGTFDKTVAFALDHPEAGWSEKTLKNVHGLFVDYLLSSGSKICHNLGFEMEWLGYKYGGKLLRLTDWEDTLAQAHTLDERPGASLDDLTRQHFGFFLKDQSRVVVKDNRILEFPLKEVLRYNGMDSKWCYAEFFYQKPMVDATTAYVNIYQRKIRNQPTLVLSQLKGVKVDFDYAKTMQKKFTGLATELENKISNCPEVKAYVKKFGKFSPTAPEQYSRLLKDILDRSEVNTETGGLSSDESVLSRLPASEVPSAPLILEHRSVVKMNSTYLDSILNHKMVAPDGKIHTQYKSMIAVTGRLASEDPNMQNFPKRKYVEVRGVVVPERDWFLACDYGQLEARVIGMATEDENLVKHLWTSYDIHGFWADRVLHEYPPSIDWVIKNFSVNGDDSKLVRKTLRQEMKNRWVFPLFFGSHWKSCAEDLALPESIAERLSGEFWDEFPGVKKWQDNLIKKYEKNLYVESLTGWRRRGAMTKNEIINHPIQSTGAEIVLDGMNRLSEMAMREEEEEYQPNLNMHDDLTFDVYDQDLEKRIEVITKEMCRHTFSFVNVPLIIEASIGDRWNTLKEIGIYRSNELYNIRNPYA